MVSNISLDTPIKRLPPRVYQKFSQLNSREEWRDLAVQIKNRDGTDKFVDQSVLSNVENSKNPTKTLLDIWCYDGPRFATLGALINALKAAELFHIVKYLYNDILKEPYERTESSDIEKVWKPDVSSESTLIAADTTDLPGPPLLGNPVQYSDTNTMMAPPRVPYTDHQFSPERTIEDVHTDLHWHAGTPEVGAGMASGEYDTPIAVVSQSDNTDSMLGASAAPVEDFTPPSVMVNYNEQQTSKDSTPQKELQDLVAPAEPVHYSYHLLASLTNNFDSRMLSHGGRFIGQGGYGKVYLAMSPQLKAAVKVLVKLTDRTVKEFQTEVDILKRYRHPNILPLFGYSVDGPHMCIVTEFMINGCLHERLSNKKREHILTASQRVHICKGVAKALHHLHTFNKDEPLVHRDVKSANVLLSVTLEAKLADCAMVRHGPTAPELTHSHTSRILGTPQYVPPEYLDGEVSVRLDAYSYGVVLLEVLTSLPVYDDRRDDKNLRVHLTENCDSPDDIVKYLDVNAGWDQQLAISIYTLAARFFNHKKSRPTITQSMQEILSWKE